MSNDDARVTGRRVVHKARSRMAARLAELLKRDPELMASAVETGLVRREWLEAPGSGEPVSTVTPMEVVERWLERSVEQRPSMLAKLGLSTMQILSATSEDGAGDTGSPARLAVAFTDLEGFTYFTATEGDEAASRLLSEHYKMVGPVVRSRGGRVVKRLGDGFLLTFPEPEAAVLACLELVALQPAPLRLRAGVHVGDVVVMPEDVVGHVVNVAARVAECAKGGEVLATGDVRSASEGVRGAVFGRPRRRSLKGLEPVQICRVTADG